MYIIICIHNIFLGHTIQRGPGRSLKKPACLDTVVNIIATPKIYATRNVICLTVRRHPCGN